MEQITALRAEWFVQLAEAIESAQRVAWQLGARGDGSNEVRSLYGRLEAARIELDSLQGLSGDTGPAVELEWLRKFGWSSEIELEP